MSSDARQWIEELKTAGWDNYKRSPFIWVAPCGCIYRGPALAYKVMKIKQEQQIECPNHDAN